MRTDAHRARHVDMTVTAIRLVYIFAAVIDAAIGVLLLLPEALAEMLGLAYLPARPAERLALGMTAAMLVGWTSLLLWAAASPIERRGVLLLTIFPVITGLALSVLLGWSMSYISTTGAAQVWSLQALLVGILGWAFHSAWRIANIDQPHP